MALEAAPGDAVLDPFRQATRAVEGAVAELRSQWDRLTARVAAGIDLVERRLRSDGPWDSLVEWLTDDAADGLRRLHQRFAALRSRVDDVLRRAETAFARSVPVLALMETSLAFLPVVVTPLSDLGADATPPGRNLVYWRGPAKLAYLDVLQEQAGAIDAAVGKARATSGWLVEVATANTRYLAELADRVARIAAGVATTCIEGGTTAAGVLTQFPTSIQDLAELLGDLVGELISGAAHLADRLAEVVRDVQHLAAELADHSSLPSGRWPQSVTLR